MDEQPGFQDPAAVSEIPTVALLENTDAGLPEAPDAGVQVDSGTGESVAEVEEDDAEAAEGGEIRGARECPRFEDSGSRRHGTIDGGAVRVAVTARRTSFQACYADFMMRVAPTPVRANTTFTVDRHRHIEEIDVCLSVDDPALAECIEEVFRSIEYPRPEGGPANVFYPIDLSP